ncbi:tyrosine-type recombinase/integrase [Streptomyces sp. NPDC004291]
MPHTVPHDLRYFHASALIAGGASAKQVRLVLGHASTVITLRIYAHLWPDEDDRTRTAVDTVFGAPRTGCGRMSGTTCGSAGRVARWEIRPSSSPRKCGRSRR